METLTKVEFGSEWNKAGNYSSPMGTVLDPNLIHDGRFIQMKYILSKAI